MFSNQHEHSRPTWTRRKFIRDAFCGFGGLALASLLYEQETRAATTNPLAPKPPHFPKKAKSVIFLFMSGGPSHMETFDPKPLLNELSGQARPKEFGEAKYQFIKTTAKLLGTRRIFGKYGRSGIEVSDLFPNVATCVDDLAVIRAQLAGAVAALRATTEWAVANFAGDVRGVFAGAVPFLRMWGFTVAGWQMARAAAIAQRRLDEGSGDAAFYRAKIATARFYGDHVLVQAPGLRDTVVKGAAGVMALSDEQL